jgi:serine protease Do
LNQLALAGHRLAVDGDDDVVGADAGKGELIQVIAARKPGTAATLQVIRDGRTINVPVKLAERPPRERRPEAAEREQPQPSSQRDTSLGMSVRDLDREMVRRFNLPSGTAGVVVSRVEPMSPAFDAEIERGNVLLEINRRPVRSIEDYERLTARTHPGDVLTLYVYKPQSGRALHTLKID